MYNLFPTLCSRRPIYIAPKKNIRQILRTFDLWLFLHFLWYFLLITLASFSLIYFSWIEKILHLCTNINYAIKFLFSFSWRTLNFFFGKVLSSEMSGQKFHKLFTFQPILFSYARARVSSFGFLFSRLLLRLTSPRRRNICITFNRRQISYSPRPESVLLSRLASPTVESV